MSTFPATPDLFERAWRFAALSGPFRPLDAFADAPANPDALVDELSKLAAKCDTKIDADEKRWVLRTSERRWTLNRLQVRGELADAILERRAAPEDQETTDLLAALAGEPPFDPASLEDRLRTEQDEEFLQRTIVALDRAGPAAPAWKLAVECRAALAAETRRRRSRHLQDAHFVGRSDECATIAEWIARPASTPPVRALFFSGMPGIGKSWLLEEAARRARDLPSPPITVRLDFDRAGLDVADLLGLTAELARQVAERLPRGGEALVEARLKAASVTAATSGEQRDRDTIPKALTAAIASGLASERRPLLLILDTLEVLRARGESHPRRLFDWMDRLLAAGVGPIAVLAAGRGDALDSASERVAYKVALSCLEPDAAMSLLESLGVPAGLRDRAASAAEGNPLSLRLVAKLVADEGGEFLRARRGKSLSSAQLYRFLLSRISDPALKKLARPGLVVRVISADVVKEVLASIQGLGTISDAEAARLFNALASEHWLVEPDPLAPGFVRHRADMRHALLPLLYKDNGGLCARIDRAAMRWFAARPEPWCAAEAAYHRLQLMRVDHSMPSIPVEVARQLDEESIADLPHAAAEFVRDLRGERGMSARSAEGIRSDDPGLLKELLGIIARRDWGEGRYIVERIALQSLDPRSEVAAALQTFYWRSGRWSVARRLLRERDRLTADEPDLEELDPYVALASLEMRAELASGSLRKLQQRRGPFGPGVIRQVDVWRPPAAGRAFGAALTTAVEPPSPPGIDDQDPFWVLSIAKETWTGRQSKEQSADSSPDSVGARFARRVGHAPSGSLMEPGRPFARAAAALSFYEGFASTLDKVWRSGKLRESAQVFDLAISQAAGAPFDPLGLDGAIEPSSEQPIEGLGALGLFAEWAEAQAFLDRDADLRLIGRSAEKWRRMLAGVWTYGRSPQRWEGRALDVTLASRLEALLAQGGGAAAAEHALDLWTRGESARVLRRVRATVFAALHRLEPASRHRPAALAHELARTRMPALFIPSLAVLGTVGGDVMWGGSNEQRGTPQ